MAKHIIGINVEVEYEKGEDFLEEQSNRQENKEHLIEALSRAGGIKIRDLNYEAFEA